MSYNEFVVKMTGIQHERIVAVRNEGEASPQNYLGHIIYLSGQERVLRPPDPEGPIAEDLRALAPILRQTMEGKPPKDKRQISERSLVLEGAILTPIAVTLDAKGHVQSYSIESFKSETEKEWWTYVRDNKDLIGLAINDYQSFAYVQSYFGIRYDTRFGSEEERQQADRDLKVFRSQYGDYLDTLTEDKQDNLTVISKTITNHFSSQT